MPSSRRPEIDVLRVITMLLVLVAHGAQPFNPWDEWHVRSPERSKWIGELVLLLAPWVMPMFMLLAGASAWHSLAKRSSTEYLNERVTRLILPLVAGTLLLIPPQMYVDRTQRGLFDGSFLEFYPRFFDGVYPRGNFGVLHLWFLAMLALFALITLPLFQWLRGPAGRRAMSRLARPLAPPGAILLLAIPIIGVRAALWAAFPDTRPVVTDWQNRTTLLPVFVYGYMLAAEPALLRAVDRQWKLAVGVGFVYSAIMFAWAWPGDLTQRFPTPFSRDYVVLWTFYTIGAWVWPVAVLGAARAYGMRESQAVVSARGLVNPFYMLHQPVIVVLGFFVVRGRAGPAATFLVLLAASFGITLALCLLARHWRVTRALFGARPPLLAE